MTRERISKLNDSDLLKLADKLSLDPFDEYDLDPQSDAEIPGNIRSELELLIYEELEEHRQEQKETDSHPINYHQKHFISIEDFFGYPLEDESAFFTFPNQYNVTRIMLMLRDPEWAYSYWDISNQDRARITGEPEFLHFSVNIKELLGDSFDKAKEETNAPEAPAAAPVDMEIPVRSEDNNWYINIPRRNRSYVVELSAVYSSRREVLARSGAIRVPGGNFSKDLENISNQESEVLIALSGIEDLGVSSFEGAPRRLIEVLEQD
jgi:hypothetical protein